MILSALSLFFSAWSLRPGKRSGVTPKTLGDRWIDSRESPRMAEVSILREKINFSTLRETQIRNRANAVGGGFVVLAGAIIALVVIYSYNLSIG
jgi:hypothetical protein